MRWPKEAYVFRDRYFGWVEAIDLLGPWLWCRTLESGFEYTCENDHQLTPLTPAAREMLAIAKGGRA